MNWWGIRLKITEPRQASISSNVEPEAKLVVAVVSRSGGARRKKPQLGRRTARRDLLGVDQRKENEEDVRYPENGRVWRFGERDTYRVEAVAIGGIERTAEDFHRARKARQNWIWMR
jgi:hypothetical protein